MGCSGTHSGGILSFDQIDRVSQSSAQFTFSSVLSDAASAIICACRCSERQG